MYNVWSKERTKSQIDVIIILFRSIPLQYGTWDHFPFVIQVLVVLPTKVKPLLHWKNIWLPGVRPVDDTVPFFKVTLRHSILIENIKHIIFITKVWPYTPYYALMILLPHFPKFECKTNISFLFILFCTLLGFISWHLQFCLSHPIHNTHFSLLNQYIF